jgi:hypothetical protein
MRILKNCRLVIFTPGQVLLLVFLADYQTKAYGIYLDSPSPELVIKLKIPSEKNQLILS